ncbi:radical SAM/SPASM domain-containing protein [Candidatus Magnetaquicoccus inordinatus]|uniref:radical SAM/SPASM domain-containing protein n=1 Tax=Candidatus Magnetaquicoccus inordinatus TaxID=2496818 RepID=UPI00102C7AF5|nr:radical SAM/SPASM domain-containing protein [Candidatus Magnetaquicoccus inordinatus]
MTLSLAQRVTLANKPLGFNALVVERTSRCNARCAICYQGSSPQGKVQKGKKSANDAKDLSPELIRRALLEGSRLDSLNKRFHLAGGEAFLDAELCLELFAYAQSLGYYDITTTTNGFWAKSPDKARILTRRMREAGVTNIELSTDHWHAPFVQPTTINNCLRACLEAGISVNLRLLATHEHTHAATLATLDPYLLNHTTRITCGPVFAVGRATEQLSTEEFFRRGAEGRCFAVLNLAIVPNGNVFPCCAGMDHTDGLLFGNIAEQHLAEIVHNINHSPLFRVVSYAGVSRFLQPLQHLGYPMKTSEEYGNMCDLCSTIFSNRQMVADLSRYNSQLEAEQVRMAIEYLQQSSAA